MLGRKTVKLAKNLRSEVFHNLLELNTTKKEEQKENIYRLDISGEMLSSIDEESKSHCVPVLACSSKGSIQNLSQTKITDNMKIHGIELEALDKLRHAVSDMLTRELVTSVDKAVMDYFEMDRDLKNNIG